MGGSQWPSSGTPDVFAQATTSARQEGNEGAVEEVKPPVAEVAEPTVSAADDLVDTGQLTNLGPDPDSLAMPPPMPPPPPLPVRPGLSRNSLQPAPPLDRGKAPPPPTTDSLSLTELRRLVAEVNRASPVAYDYVYSDLGPHPEEVDEWFVYQFWQWVRLNAAQKAFEWQWNLQSGAVYSWEEADDDVRTHFIQAAISGVQSNDAALRAASIGNLLYLVLGRWGDTAGTLAAAASPAARSIATPQQLEAMKDGVQRLASLGGLAVVWEALRTCFEMHWSGDAHQASPQEAQDELMNLMTILYMAIQETLHDPGAMATACEKLLELNPSLVDFMLTATAKLRWDEQGAMPQTQIFLLFWKSILLVFGGSKELEDLKRATSEMAVDDLDTETITASPLDYHVFRQEISSKYPAYVPPLPAIPLEAENTSLLPPLPPPLSRSPASSGVIFGPAQSQNGGGSILHQPVHIATPAPSPPPSPGVGGKGVKKQNYQTNQNLPFMYPPLDATSNSAGGKGMNGLQDSLVSRRWEGGDIPASILEAGELFSSRVRMTRATRQLWEERERFLKFERGWQTDDDDDSLDNLDLDELTADEKEVLAELRLGGLGAKPGRGSDAPADEAEVDFGPRPAQLSDRDKQRLMAVEQFYREALPHLQSLVIVLLRPILANVTAIVTQHATGQANGNNNNNSSSNGMVGGRNGNFGGGGGYTAQQQHPGEGPTFSRRDDEAAAPERSAEETDASRTREITAKAITGILILLLKWLRLSHVLKFEYLTQLLLDSNYIPLILKLFAHQDIQQVVDSRMDRVDNSFFQFCNLRSRQREMAETDNESGPGSEGKESADGQDQAEAKAEDGSGRESDDSAAPPPIKRWRPRGPATAAAEAEAVAAAAATAAEAEASNSDDEAQGVEAGGGQDEQGDYDDDGNMDNLETGLEQHEGDSKDKDVDDKDEDGRGKEGKGEAGGEGEERPDEADETAEAAKRPVAAECISDYSRRNFFSLINYLRVLQKMCKNKAHRNLLLVQYKSSTILRKSLAVPQDDLRLYTLKLFKSQVPFCGRKWRQSNMRVITAVYLHCRPELRDEWLAGSDVDAEVEGALPLEQALRSLTHWRNVRRYPDKIAAEIRTAMREEQDFFMRELEKLDMDGAMAASTADDSMGDMDPVEG